MYTELLRYVINTIRNERYNKYLLRTDTESCNLWCKYELYFNISNTFPPHDNNIFIVFLVPEYIYFFFKSVQWGPLYFWKNIFKKMY